MTHAPFIWLALALLLAAQDASSVEFTPRELRKIARLGPLGEPPADPTNAFSENADAAHLGQFLFFDKRLSANGEVACATCHMPDKGFSDGKQLAETLERGTRHTPSLVNVAFGRWFFWDGRADSLWAQALEPIENPAEMDSDRLAVAHLLHADAGLRKAYTRVFGALPELDDAERFPAHARPSQSDSADERASAWDAMASADREAVNSVYVNVGKSIAAYEQRLVRGDSAFDRFAANLALGKPEGMPASAQRGLKLFLGKANCVLCHDGPNFSDSEFHNTAAPGLHGGELRDTGRYGGADLVAQSRFNASGEFSDDNTGTAARRVQALKQFSETWGQFKTPSLRNLKDTAPYMHQGQFAELGDVLHFYATREGAARQGHHQETILQPFELSPPEAADLLAFLAALEGAQLPEELLRTPESSVRKKD
jgi:cytochrome c peroxidase